MHPRGKNKKCVKVSVCLSSGELLTLAVLDRESDGEFNLVAKATDGGGRSCQADIQLMVQDMNDNQPLFSASHYMVTVFDNTTVRTPVAVIYAKDPDAGEPHPDARCSEDLSLLTAAETAEKVPLFLSGHNLSR